MANNTNGTCPSLSWKPATRNWEEQSILSGVAVWLQSGRDLFLLVLVTLSEPAGLIVGLDSKNTNILKYAYSLIVSVASY